MKIIEFIPQLGSGGGERFTVDLCNELAERNEVILCLSHSLDKIGFYKDDINEKIRVVCFNKKAGMDLGLLFRFYKFVKKEKPNVVHTHLSAIEYTILANYLCRDTFFFHTVHNDAEKETMGLRISRIVRKFMFGKKRTCPVTISKESQKSFELFYGMSAPMIPNGRNIPSNLEVSNVVCDEIKRYKETSHTKILVHLAHIDKVKRQHISAKAVDRLTKEGYDIAILYIGKQREKEILAQIESINNPRIHLLGEKNNPLEYLKMADAFCLCSEYEGFPISLIEAIGVGCVPICTPVGGIVNVIKNRVNGFLTDDISEKSFYSTLKQYLDLSESEKNTMRQMATASYAPYSMTECASKYLSLFNNYINE